MDSLAVVQVDDGLYQLVSVLSSQFDREQSSFEEFFEQISIAVLHDQTDFVCSLYFAVDLHQIAVAHLD